MLIVVPVSSSLLFDLYFLTLYYYNSSSIRPNTRLLFRCGWRSSSHSEHSDFLEQYHFVISDSIHNNQLGRSSQNHTVHLMGYPSTGSPPISYTTSERNGLVWPLHVYNVAYLHDCSCQQANAAGHPATDQFGLWRPLACII